MAEGTGVTPDRFDGSAGGNAFHMADSENVEHKAVEHNEKVDDKYENAVAAAADKLDKPAEKITELGRRLTGMEENSEK